MNPLGMIPDGLRRWLYLAYAVLGLGVASVATYCTATSADVPGWSIGVGAVLAGPLAAVFGLTAASNMGQANTISVTGPPGSTVSATGTLTGETTEPDARPYHEGN